MFKTIIHRWILWISIGSMQFMPCHSIPYHIIFHSRALECIVIVCWRCTVVKFEFFQPYFMCTVHCDASDYCMKLIFAVVLSMRFILTVFPFLFLSFSCRTFECIVWTQLDNAGARTVTPFRRFNYKSNQRWTERSDGRETTPMDIHWSTIIFYNTNHNNW